MNIIYRFYAAVLCGYLALGATLQVLPMFMIQAFHANSLIIAAIITITSIAAAITRIIAGYAVDIELARQTMLIGSILAILGGIGHWYASNLWILVGARLLFGAGEGALFTAAVVSVISKQPIEQRGAIAGWFGLSMWSGLCCGPILATGLLYISGQITLVWLTVIGLPILSFLLIYPIELSQHNSQPITAISKRFLLPSGMLLPGFAFLLTSYGYGAINSLLILAIIAKNVHGVTLALPLFAASFLLTRIIGGAFVTKYGGKVILLYTVIVEVCGLLLLTTNNTVPILLGTALTGMGIALLYPAFVAIILNKVLITQHGIAIGALTSFWDIGLMLSGPIGGYVATHYSFNSAFLLASGLSCCAFLIILYGDNNVRRCNSK